MAASSSQSPLAEDVFSELDGINEADIDDACDRSETDPCDMLEASELNEEQSDAELCRRLRAKLVDMTPRDAFQILTRRESLVKAQLLHEEALITVSTDGSSAGDFHILMHEKKAKETPIFQPEGAPTGYLYPLPESPNSAILKVSAAMTKHAKAAECADAYQQLSVSVWREVKIGSKHGGMLANNLKAPKKYKDDPSKDDYEDIKPKISLVVFQPKAQGMKRQRQGQQLAGSASSSAMEEVAKAAAREVTEEMLNGDVNIGGSATVGNDLVVGPGGSGIIHGRLAGKEADHAECMPRFDEAEEINAGDVVALVGDSDGLQKVSRKARGSDRAEWRVVATRPQILGNRPEPGEEHTVAEIVLSGQVPVRVAGTPSVDAFLVPSGLEDGCARVLSDEERPLNVLGQVIDSRLRSGRVIALVQKGMETGPMNRYLLRELDRMRGEFERVQAEKAAPSQVAMEGRSTASQATALPTRVHGKCANAECAFLCTGIVPHHCCRRCASFPGQHEPNCQRKEAGSDDGGDGGGEGGEGSGGGGAGASSSRNEEARGGDQGTSGADGGSGSTTSSKLAQRLETDCTQLGHAFAGLSMVRATPHQREYSAGGYTEAARTPVKGEWPWDEVGKLDSDGRSVVTPADVALNRLSLVFVAIDWGWGSGGLGVRRELADCLSGCSAQAHATIRATGEKIQATGHGDSSAEAVALAKWRLLEANDCALLALLAKCQSDAAAQSADAGTGAKNDRERAIAAAEGKDAATGGKSRLNAMAHRLLAGRMSALQGKALVEYKPVTPGAPPGGGDSMEADRLLTVCPAVVARRGSARVRRCRGAMAAQASWAPSPRRSRRQSTRLLSACSRSLTAS